MGKRELAHSIMQSIIETPIGPIHPGWRFPITQGMNKKQITQELKEVKKEISEITEKVRTFGQTSKTGMFLLAYQEELIIKEGKLKKIIKLHNNFGTDTIKKAKQYPIEQLLQFDRAGYIKCLWHDEKNGSLHWDKKRNKAHCFAGCGDFDSLDIYMKLYKVDLPVAIKALS